MEENLHKELAELSPLLSELRKKKEDYQLPDGYFQQLQANVLEQLKGEKPLIAIQPPSAKQSVSIWEQILTQLEWLIRPRYAVAFGSVAFLVVASWFLFKSNEKTVDNCATLACVPDTELEQYIEENIEDFETELLWQSTEGNAIAEAISKTSTSEQEKKPTNPKAKYHLKEANDEELDEMLDEMIQNGELSEEELEDIL